MNILFVIVPFNLVAFKEHQIAMYFLFCPLRPLTEGIHIEHTLNIDTTENLINHLFSLCDCLCDFVCSFAYGKDTEVKFKSIVLITRI